MSTSTNKRPPNKKGYKVFISYSHEDERAKNELVTHLRKLEINIEAWTDDKILAGDNIDQRIKEAIDTSDLVLYLVSKCSLLSPECSKELTQAKRNNLIYIPIILEKCPWNKNILIDNRIKVLPKNAKPIDEWDSRESAWADTAEQIEKSLLRDSKTHTSKQAEIENLWGRAMFLHTHNAYQELIKVYDKIIKHDSNDADAYTNRGGAKAALGNYEEAISDFDTAISLNPQLAIAYNNRGLTKKELKKYEKAISDLDTAISLDSEYATAYYNRGNIKRELEKYEVAISDFDTAISLDSEYATAYNNRGLAKIALRKYEAAISDFDTVISLDPHSITAYNNRGNIKRELGKYEAAISDFDTAISLDPHSAIAYNNRGNVKGTLGNYEEAILDFDTAISLDPQLITAYNNRGNAKGELGKYEEAILDFDTAISFDPRFAATYNDRGLAKKELKKYEEAISDFDTAISLDPRSAAAYYNRGNAKAALGNYEEAISNFDTAISLNPHFAVAYNNRGNVKAELKKYEEAISDLDTAISLDPKLAGLYYNRGSIKRELKKYEEAISDLDTAISLDPHSATAYNNRGNIKRELKKYEKAISDFDTAISLDPHSAAAYYNRGLAKTALKKYEEATADFEKAASLDPNFAAAYHHRKNVQKDTDAHTTLTRGIEKTYISHKFSLMKIPLIDDASLYEGLTWNTEEVYRTLDHDGNTMILRPDITLFLARQIALQMGNSLITNPIRKFFSGPILHRQQQHDLIQTERYQSDVEIIGGSAPDTDHEIMKLLEKILETTEIKEYYCHVGSRAFLNATWEKYAHEQQHSTIKTWIEAITQHKWDVLAAIWKKAGNMPSEGIEARIELYRFIGTHAELKNKFETHKKTLATAEAAAIEYLIRYGDRIKKHPIARHVRFDLAEIGTHPYYTGIQFQVYTPHATKPIACGGRTDTLLTSLGAQKDTSMVGFSLYPDVMLHAKQHLALSTGGKDTHITIAVPQGRLLKAIAAHFNRCGIECSFDNRKLSIDVPVPQLKLKLHLIRVKNGDVPAYIGHNIAHLGICGYDILYENSSRAIRLHRFDFAEKAQVRFCLIGAQKNAISSIDDTFTVTTKYPRLTEYHLKPRYRNLEILKLQGSIELAPRLGLSPYITDIVETGETLKQNNLEIIEELERISIFLVANPAFYKSHYKSVDRLVQLLAQGTGKKSEKMA